MGHHQQRACLGRLVIQSSRKFELGYRLRIVTLSKLAHAERGMDDGHFRSDCTGLFEILRGTGVVPVLKRRFARDHEELRILRRVFQCIRNHGGSAVEIAVFQKRRCQKLTGVQIFRVRGEVFFQILLGLLGRAECVLHRACQK